MTRLPWRMRLPTRLALGYGLFFAVVLAILCTGVVLLVRQVQLNQLQEYMATSGQLIAEEYDARDSSLETVFDSPAILLRSLPQIVGGLDSPALFAQVEAADGRVIVRSLSLKDETIAVGVANRAAALAGEQRFFSARIQGVAALVFVRPLTDNQQTRGVLVVGHTLTDVDRLIQALMMSLAGVSLIALIATIRGGAWLAEGSLQPVALIARTARRIAGTADLSERVPLAPQADELSELTTTINEMLARMERLFHAQQRFVADVSHELRTPLAAMRGTLEVIRRENTQDSSAIQESLAGIERETHRLTRMASDLLLLAQADAGIALQIAPVALDELVLEVVRDMRPLAGDIRLRPLLTEQIEVLGDRDRIKQALINLTANALSHTPANGVVTLKLSRSATHAQLQIQDTGSGIAANQLPYIFDRFYRADAARSRNAGGAGLGLAIVRWIAEAHGGQVFAESTLGVGSTFTITIPFAAPTPNLARQVVR
jgi:two-component system, OmpR family, sensor kinase